MKKHVQPFLSLHGALITVMTVLMLAFTSAEVRATVMMRMAEEQGVGRFYEDKIHHASVEVVRLGHAQTRRDPSTLPLVMAPSPSLAAAPAFTTRSRATAVPRAPPHQPRAPPVTA